MHYWDHEPRAVPRRTESADKSDALQTLRAVRRRRAVAKRLECVRLQRRFSKASCVSMAGAGSSKALFRFLACIETMNSLPTLPSSGGARRSQFPSWEGSGVG